MKKIIFAICIILCILLYMAINKNISGLSLIANVSGDENRCFDKSYNQISDSMITSWDSAFTKLGIRNNPFAVLIFFIKYFSDFEQEYINGCFTLNEIFLNRKSTLKSNILATCAIMQKLGWDVLCFYNKRECYLGINFVEKWKIRKGSWVEKEKKIYFLKEFDEYTPVGELKLDNPASIYKSIKSEEINLKPIPLINNLPIFSNVSYRKRLKWQYQDKEYVITASIPKEQIEWTKNLPPSLYGMAYSGIEELKNIGIVDKLKFLSDEFGEFDKVNFLYKFCQSESIFVYDNKQPIASVSRQLIDGRNDCDGRSVFLYCLLRSVLDYSDADIIFIGWPNHVALGLQPKTKEAEGILKKSGFYIGNKYYVLDAAYAGDTQWGSKMEHLPEDCEVIK